MGDGILVKELPLFCYQSYTTCISCLKQPNGLMCFVPTQLKGNSQQQQICHVPLLAFKGQRCKLQTNMKLLQVGHTQRKFFISNQKSSPQQKTSLDGNATHRHNLYTPLQPNGFNSPQQWKPFTNKQHHIFQKLLLCFIVFFEGIVAKKTLK